MTTSIPSFVSSMFSIGSVVSGMIVVAANAQAVPHQTPAADSVFRTDSAIVTGVLPNGLRYYVRQNAKPANRVELRLVVKAGSLQEDDDQRGLAHFVEHLAFNGTTHFRKQELISYLESIGMRFGADLNAYTSFDRTVYSLQVPTDDTSKVSTAVQILEDWAHGVSFDPKEVEAERGVIISEWRSRLGVGARVMNKHMPAMYHGSRYQDRMPIGDIATIQNAKAETIRRFYKDWYRPDLMSVIVVGDVDPRRMETMIRAHFGAIQMPGKVRPRQTYSIPANGAPHASIVTDPELTSASASYAVRMPAPEPLTIAGYRTGMIQRIFDALLTRRMRELTLRPDAPYLDAGSGREGLDNDAMLYKVNVAVKGNDVTRGLDAALTEVERVAQHGFTAAELERERKGLLRSIESSANEQKNVRSAQLAGAYVEGVMADAPLMSVADGITLARSVIPTITLGEVNREARVWRTKENRIFMVNMPQRENLTPPTQAMLLAVLDSVSGRTLAAYTERVESTPLLAILPTPGTVAAEKYHASVGVTEWTLSNGVRVLLKPTDFRADYIGLVGTSLGGYYAVPDSDFVTGRLIELVSGASGYGPFSANDLRKQLAGKIVGLSQNVQPGAETISASSSRSDAETMFQLLYLAVTAPRYDSVTVAARIENARASLLDRNGNPAVAFADSVNAVMTRAHPKAAPITVATLDSFKPRRAVEILKERFSNIDDFTFMIVGSFSPDSIKSLVIQYLGSLPRTNRRETTVDPGIRPPDGVVKRTVYAGSEPQARTIIAFKGEYVRNSLDAAAELTMLQNVLSGRLRERLREQLGGTYGVSVQSNIQTEPDTKYMFAVEFISDPARKDEMVRAAFEVVEKLKREGPTQAEVQKAIELVVHEQEIARKTNDFWFSLLDYDRRGLAYDELLRDDRWRRATPAIVQQAARAYLNPADYVQFDLMPVVGASATSH